jgi:hypothetical protein
LKAIKFKLDLTKVDLHVIGLVLAIREHVAQRRRPGYQTPTQNNNNDTKTKPHTTLKRCQSFHPQTDTKASVVDLPFQVKVLLLQLQQAEDQDLKALG